MSKEAPVYVTGMGAVTPLGIGVDETWRNIKAGKSSVKRIDDLIDTTDLKSKIGSPVEDFDPSEWFNSKRAEDWGGRVSSRSWLPGRPWKMPDGTSIRTNAASK